MPLSKSWALVALVLPAACGPIALGAPGCAVLSNPRPLPEPLAEASGAAVGLRDPSIVWTHGDGGRQLWAVDRGGTPLGVFRLDVRPYDWEDLAVAPCGSEGSTCVYAADTGDNYEQRSSVSVLRATEPALDGSWRPGASPLPLATERFPIRLPDGPRDIEALAVLPGERLLLITKGRDDAVSVYRYPGALRPDTVTLEEIQRLSDGPRILPRQVTGASARGDVVAVRTYESLRLYRWTGERLEEVAGPVNLRILGEAQGEGVALGPDGEVILTSEAGPVGSAGSIAVIRCRTGESGP